MFIEPIRALWIRFKNHRRAIRNQHMVDGWFAGGGHLTPEQLKELQTLADSKEMRDL